MAKRGREPERKYGRQWVAIGGPWVYRRPSEEHGRWRVRRRNTITGEKECITLEAKKWTAAEAEARGLAAQEEARAAAEAEKRRQEEEARARGETLRPEISDVTLGDALDRWMTSIEPDLRPSSAETYGQDIEKYKRLLGAHRLVREIKFGDIDGLLSGEWKDAAGATKKKHRAALVRAFDWFRKQGWCGGNPAALVDVKKSWSREANLAAQTTGRALTLEEARKLLAVCAERTVIERKGKRNVGGQGVRKLSRGDRKWNQRAPKREDLWWIVFVSLRTGLRISNVIGSETKSGLEWRHVDLEAGEIHIEAELMKNHLPLDVPMHPELQAALRDRLRTLGRVPKPTDPIVPGMPSRDLHRAFKRRLKWAELDPAIRVHDLRHSFVSWLGESCTHAVMRELAGHSAKSITDRYSHQRIETLRAGLASLPWLENQGRTGTDKEPLARNI